MEITEAMKEVIWLQDLEQTEHIIIIHHFIQNIISKGVVDVKQASTHDNPRDVMTKTILTNKLRHCLDLLGVSCTQ